MKKRSVIAALLCSLCLTAGGAVPAMADSARVVTLGADLTQDQKDTMMRYFKTDASQVQILTITNQDEREHLGDYIPLEQIGTRTLSCAYVKPTQSGGIKVRTANLNYVTGNMIANALSTAGVTNCEAVAACPYEVSGTGALTGVIMAYESASGQKLDSTKKDLATKEYADSIVAAAKTEVPIVIDADHPFPTEGYKAGQKYVVALAGTYLGHKCEVGDVILITKSYVADTASNSDGIVLQANIDGAVTGAASSVDGEIVVFSGATGKVIKSSKINMSALNDALTKAHEHANKSQLDTYDKTQAELLATAAADAQSKVAVLKKTVDGKADKATTLAGYGIEDAYNKTEIESKLKTITDNVNTKVDATTVDTKISTAKSEITTAYEESIDAKLNAKVGNLGESATVVEFVNKAVGSGGADIAGQIDNALREAKKYTDDALTIVVF